MLVRVYGSVGAPEEECAISLLTWPNAARFYVLHNLSGHLLISISTTKHKWLLDTIRE